MTQQHPITPPRELVKQWIKECDQPDNPRWQEYEQDIANRTAQWAADQELEACCEWLILNGYGAATSRLRTARRPKPPSLKELALDDLRIAFDRGCLSGIQADTIRRALEQLADDK
jgi:hypothetical protein